MIIVYGIGWLWALLALYGVYVVIQDVRGVQPWHVRGERVVAGLTALALALLGAFIIITGYLTHMVIHG